MMIFTEDKQCDECFTTFKDAKFGEGVCPTCRQMKALERIADALEYWIGLQ
jgi:uncharacterized Zn finger protein (UPF0148 family)